MAILLGKPASANPLIRLSAIREGVIFPHVEMVLTFGRSKSIAAVNESFATTKQIVFVSQKRPMYRIRVQTTSTRSAFCVKFSAL